VSSALFDLGNFLEVLSKLSDSSPHQVDYNVMKFNEIIRELSKMEATDFGSILEQKGSGGWSVLMLALAYSPEALELICELLKKLDPTNLASILKQTNEKGLSVLMVAVMSETEALEPICKLFEKLKPEDLMFILEEMNRRRGWNLLMLAASFLPKAVEPICKFLEKLDPTNLASILKETNGQNSNALMLAAESASEAVEPICKLLEKLDPTNLASILKKPDRSWKAFMLAAKYAPKAVLPICKKLVELSFTDDFDLILFGLLEKRRDVLIPVVLNCPPFAQTLIQYRDFCRGSFDSKFPDGPRFEGKVFSAFSEAMDKTSVPSSVTAAVEVTVQGGAGGPPHPEPESSSGPERPFVLESGLYFALSFRNPSFFAECLNQRANFWGNLDKCMAVLFGLESQITSFAEREKKQNLDKHFSFEDSIKKRQEFLHQCERFFVESKSEKAQAKTVFVLLLIIRACENCQAHKILGNGPGGLTHKTYRRTVQLGFEINETLREIQSGRTISEGTVESKIATAKGLFTEPYLLPTTGFKKSLSPGCSVC